MLMNYLSLAKQMSELLISIACGCLGGTVRGIIGAYKSMSGAGLFSAPYLASTVLVSGAIGGFAAAVLFSDYKIALLAGYAGLDVLENAVRILKVNLQKPSDSF